MRGKRLLIVVASGAFVALAGQAAIGQYGGYGSPPSKGLVDELTTAQTHAANASRSETLRDSLWHLGHVVNCLVGSRGQDYDAKNLNPCQGQGNGVIPDLESAVRSYQPGASKALDLARRANQLALDTLKLTELAQVKAGASKAADMLGEALKSIGQ